MEKGEKNQEISQKIRKYQEILQKINPYRKLNINEQDSFVRDSNVFINYQKLMQWAVNVLLNGLFGWFFLFSIGWQPLHWICILGDGIGIWFIFEALRRLAEIYADMKIKIKRS